METKKEFLFNFGYLESKIPKKLYFKLLEECLAVEKKNKVFVTGLTNYNIPQHFLLDKNKDELFEFIDNFRKEYESNFPGLANMGILTKDLNFYNTSPWVNIQKKNNFLPNHTHDGIYSYTIWIKIPPQKIKSIYSGNFEFSYSTVCGKTFNKIFDLTSKDEGKIIMFPSKLQHCVYPFNDTDETRISISGNILFNVP
jgi:hypothetical protein